MGVASVAALFLMPARMTLRRYPANLSLISACVSTSDALAGVWHGGLLSRWRLRAWARILQVSFLRCLA
jgi:hypothetical protein